MASEADNPEFLASQRDAEDAFAAAWRDLEVTQRALLSLRAEGYGLVEIAEITGVAKDVLGPRLHRARQSLKRNLERRKESESAVRRLGRGR
jgi:DNA-directed RNA polymerase specialized sigma24 family protein